VRNVMLCESTTPELPETLKITCPLNRRPLAHARASPMTLVHARYRGPTCTLKLQRFSARREASNFRLDALRTWAGRPACDQLGSSQWRQPGGSGSRPAFWLGRAGRAMGKCPAAGRACQGRSACQCESEAWEDRNECSCHHDTRLCRRHRQMGSSNRKARSTLQSRWALVLTPTWMKTRMSPHATVPGYRRSRRPRGPASRNGTGRLPFANRAGCKRDRD
jgi:hypothetical protein